MAPEQAAGDKKAITVATDVYGLGTILYFWLAGRAPFEAPAVPVLFDQIMHKPPPSPRRLNPDIDADLETVCLKCLEKDAPRRYASAAELAADLERWLKGEPIMARPISRLNRTWRWCRRQPALASAIVLSLLLSCMVAAWVITNEQRRRDDVLQRAKQETTAAQQRARGDKKRILVQQIQQLRLTAHSDDWSKRAMELVREALALGKDEQLRDQATATLVGVDANMPRFFVRPTSAVAFDSTGKRLLMAGGKPLFSNGNREITPAYLWDRDLDKEIMSAKTGQGPVLFDDKDNPLQLVEAPGLKLLLWNVKQQTKVGEYPVPLPPRARPEDWKFGALALSAKGDYVAAVARPEPPERGLLVVWEAATGKVALQREADASALAFGRQGPWLAVAGPDETAIWSLPEGRNIKSVRTGRSIKCLAFGRHPGRVHTPGCDGELLAAGEIGGLVTVWDVARETPLSFCHGSSTEVLGLAFFADGATLAGSSRGMAKLWDVATGQILLHLDAPNITSGIAVSPDGQCLAVSGLAAYEEPGAVNFHRLDWGRGLRNLRGLIGQVAQVRFSPDGRRIAALGQNWQVAIWSAASARLEFVLDVPQGVYASNGALAFRDDGRQFAFAAGREAKLWDLESGRIEKSWSLPPGSMDQMGFYGEKLLLFRVETADSGRYPGQDAAAAKHPRVLKLRNLLASKTAKPFKDIVDFSAGVFRTGAPADARHFVAQGLAGPDKRPTTMAYDGPTGNFLWSKPCSPDFYGAASSLWFDPAGTTMTLISDRNPNGVCHLVEMPSGKELPGPALYIGGVLALGPSAKLVGAPTSGPPFGFRLFRHDDKTPLVTLGLDKRSFHGRSEFNRAGTQVAWGNEDGSVTLCDIDEVRRRLGEVGLGW
jgi:WD40 repeat protein